MPSRLAALLTALSLSIVVLLPAPAAAATAIDLGTAAQFAVLAGSGITNSGATTITGDVGSFGSTDTTTGFETVTLIGVNHRGDAVTQTAKNDLTAAYNQAFASGPPTQVATELGGRTLTPGVYHNGTLGITGPLTLDTQGDPNAVFIFQADSTLITAAASSVVVLGGATACNVFWQVGSSATFGADSVLIGSVLADTSISAGDGATFQGRLLARGGAVTLLHNTITARTCAASAATTATTTPAAATTTDATTAATVPAAVTPTPTATTPARTTATTTRPARPTGGTATGQSRPPLATTGPTALDLLSLTGSTTIALGLLLLRLSRPLPALRHAVPRRWRTPGHHDHHQKEPACR